MRCSRRGSRASRRRELRERLSARSYIADEREPSLTVLRSVPVLGERELAVQPPLGLGLVVDAIEADDSLEEDVQLGVGRRVASNLEQGSKDV